jgi:hypothetical protein
MYVLSCGTAFSPTGRSSLAEGCDSPVSADWSVGSRVDLILMFRLSLADLDDVTAHQLRSVDLVNDALADHVRDVRLETFRDSPERSKHKNLNHLAHGLASNDLED